LIAGLNRHRFGISARGITPGPRVSLGNGEIDKDWQADIDRPGSEKKHLNLHIIDQVINVVTHLLSGQKELFVVAGIHKMVFVALVVQILHFAFFQIGFLKLIV